MIQTLSPHQDPVPNNPGLCCSHQPSELLMGQEVKRCQQWEVLLDAMSFREVVAKGPRVSLVHHYRGTAEQAVDLGTWTRSLHTPSQSDGYWSSFPRLTWGRFVPTYIPLTIERESHQGTYFTKIPKIFYF